MIKRLKLSTTTFLNPELPLFVLGVTAGAIICILAAIIFWSTFQRGLPGFSIDFTLENYREVLLYPILPRAALNTLTTSAGTLLIACFFAPPLAWLIHRTNVPWKSFFLTLMFLHVLLPGFLRTIGWIMMLSPEIGIINQLLRTFIPVETGPLSIYNVSSIALLQGVSLTPTLFFMVAFAFAVAYASLLIVKQVPFFYGSLAAIILADTMRRLPSTTRTISGSFIQTHPELEEAVQVSGGSRVMALRKVIVPLIIPALFYSFVWAVLHSYREVSIALFLQSPRNMVISTCIWQRWQSGESAAAAAALGVIMVLGMGIVLLPLLKIFPQIFGERNI